MDRVVDTNMRRHYQRQWYERQKAKSNGYEGYVYGLITTKGESYIGSTNNSLKKRLWQHNGGSLSSTRGLKVADIIELEAVGLGEDLRQREQKWIDMLRPSLNYYHAVSKEKFTRRSRCAVTINGVGYKSMVDALRHVGKVPYGTMRSRLFRGSDVMGALGLSKPIYTPVRRNLPKYPVWAGKLLSLLEMGWWYGADRDDKVSSL